MIENVRKAKMDEYRQLNVSSGTKLFDKVETSLKKAEHIDEERDVNLKTYHEKKAELYNHYAGKYVVIARGEIQAIGDSFDDVKNVGLDANQRFIFVVEQKQKVIGKFRWPMKRK